jgi:PAS domain-containing protein
MTETATMVTDVERTEQLRDGDFRLVADNIPILCWMVEADGSIIWYNRRCHEYCGWTPESMADGAGMA